MWLFIDSSDRGQLRLALFPIKGKIRAKTYTKLRVNVPSTVAAFIDMDELKAMKGICVVAGPGSFSAIRSGVLVANILARTLNKPLMGVSKEESLDLSALRDRLVAGEVNAVSYVAPVYDAEPNITC